MQLKAKDIAKYMTKRVFTVAPDETIQTLVVIPGHFTKLHI